MSRYIVDASVAIKWFLPEPDDDKARLLLEADHDLLAPDLLIAEVGNVLWKRFKRAELNLDEAQAILTGLESIKIAWHPIAPLSPNALDIACQLSRTVYDSLYLALAVIEHGVLVTSDERLYNAIATSELSSSIVLLAHFAA